MSCAGCIFNEMNYCEALTKRITHKDCPFRKSPRDFSHDCDRANERLRSLPEQEQKAIAELYHNGSRPWDVKEVQA